MNDTSKLKKCISMERIKYPAAILLIGVLFMIFPETSSNSKYIDNETTTLSQILNSTSGVGECKVLISDKGVVVVCEGANNAKVRLEIIHAVGSYTGYSSDKITILKLAE